MRSTINTTLDLSCKSCQNPNFRHSPPTPRYTADFFQNPKYYVLKLQAKVYTTSTGAGSLSWVRLH